MSRRYNTGPKRVVIQKMAECAIRDQLALIDAMTPADSDSETKTAIEDCKRLIRDFQRIQKLHK